MTTVLVRVHKATVGLKNGAAESGPNAVARHVRNVDTVGIGE